MSGAMTDRMGTLGRTAARRPRAFWSSARPWALVGCLLGALPAASGASAQTPFADLEFDSSRQIDVAADSLEVRDQENMAVFSGDVDVQQGPMRLRADRLEVFYREGGQGGGAQGAIDRIKASGDVLMSNGDASARARRLDYAVSDARVVLSGDVLLVQDDNALSGSRLVINLDAGTAFLSGRVRGRAGGVGDPKDLVSARR